MIETILIGVITGLILLFFNRSSLFKQPKIYISFRNAGSAYQAVRDNASNAQWRGVLIFKNFAPYPAFNLSIVKSSENKPFHNLLPNSINLMSDKEYEVKATISKLISVQERRNIATNTAFEPEEFKNIFITLKYKNESGRYFYTKYVKENQSEKCKYTFIKFFT